MKNCLTALILTLILSAVILAGCASTANEITEPGPMPTENTANADLILTSEAAEAIALSNEGLTAAQVTGLVTEYEVDDGVKEYEIDFRNGDYDYEYTINAETGKITSRDKEHDPVETALPATEPPATEPTATEPPATEAQKTSTSKSSSSGTSSTKTSSSSKSSSSSSKNSSGLIGESKAKSIALDHAGVKSSKATNMRCAYEIDDGVKEYEVDFRSGDYEYDYTIHAETGKIRSWDKEYDPVKSTSSTKETEPKETKPKETEPKATEAKDDIISASKAKSIALDHAGVKSSKATNMRCEYEIDDGVKEYEVDFRSGDYEYDYTINAETGKITSHDKEYDPVKSSSSTKETKPKETEPKATEAKDDIISASKAKSIALNHAGVSSSDARGMECEYDVDDGRKTYEVSFRSGSYEYDYEIDAETGKIISWDKEKDD